jgi:hypothetical protein
MPAHVKYTQSDPRHHTSNIRAMLEDLIQHLREDVTKVDDPRAQALLTAEVLGGLATAYDHYESKAEEAWHD